MALIPLPRAPTTPSPGPSSSGDGHWTHSPRARGWARDDLMRADASMRAGQLLARPGPREPSLLVPMLRMAGVDALLRGYGGEPHRIEQIVAYSRWLWGVGAPWPDRDDAEDPEHAPPRPVDPEDDSPEEVRSGLPTA